MNATKPNNFPVRHVRVVANALVCWAALVFLFATQFMLVGSFSWRDAFLQAGSFWALWVVFLPAAVWLSLTLPLEPGRALRHVRIHMLVCLLVVTASQIAYRNFALMPPPPEEIRKFVKLMPTPMARSSMFKGFLSLRAGLDILVYWSAVGVCQAIANFRRSQERDRRSAELEARLARSKLQALRMQINPHFLFNTLNAISTLIYVDPSAADQMLGDLSELLRRSLDTFEEQEVPLSRELEFTRAYIAIEQKRFGKRLRWEQDLPEEVLKARVPALILQPLVENAIRHGIEPQQAPGTITISAKREGKCLHLTVKDDGKGPSVEVANGKARSGIGLTNSQSRLRDLYGVDQEFTFRKGEPRGCIVEVRLPFHTEPLDLKPGSAQPTL